ncbi:winged helix-turn-helix transcriptional regulator [Actinoalloteichus sp. GBA129-24]|uniref:winged helix-turn-helix transcriptional regulator n=1 Tax=Actinoalloteichus sp. GBA129-24 TaxID=1612551 RepID=UPI0009504F50|nr:helix-turn-helix domain-containing protein [Actinoalloteichus sp. GBA129-24]APU22589.1 transcriptional regulator, HxlR family [Actinoalloteichus sp. GBA129-24]
MDDFDTSNDVFLADCPARLAVEIIADKWAVVVLYALSQGPRRHGVLIDLIGGISKKVLTETVRRLARHGLVERHAFREVPRRVEYELTELGQTLIEPIRVLTRWSEDNGAAILAAQEESDARSAPAEARA